MPPVNKTAGGVAGIAEALPAASVLLVQDGASGLEVLMIERAKTMRFAPGAFVFPGGKVDKEDSDKALWHSLTNANDDYEDYALRLAVLRELYEETNVLLTVDTVPYVPSFNELGGGGLREYLLRKHTQLNLAGLLPFAHWVTPETMPRRFDTHFYIAAHNGQQVTHDGNEAVSYRWVNPAALLDDWGSDKVPLMFPTRLNLIKLARAKSVAEAMEQAKNTRVVRTLPVIERNENGIKLTIDEAAGYGVTDATEKELKVERPK